MIASSVVAGFGARPTGSRDAVRQSPPSAWPVANMTSGPMNRPSSRAEVRVIQRMARRDNIDRRRGFDNRRWLRFRSEEHKSELQSLMRKSYAVFCLKKKKKRH